MESKRLFVGIELPGKCRQELADLDPHLAGLRWLPAKQLHMTLSFLGEVNAAKEALLREALSSVKVPPFFLPLAGVGSFNSRGCPSIVWAGVGKGHPHLFLLHRRVQDAVIHAGLEPDLKPFHPHVTIGRARDVSKQALQPFLRKYTETEFDLFNVTGFTLFSSVLAPEGATYHMEMKVEF